MRSAAVHGPGAIFFVLLPGMLCFQGDIALGHATIVESPRQATRTAVERFNEAFNRHDADALATLVTDDTVFEHTSLAPDGRRLEGRAGVVTFWREWFMRNADARFEAEEM